MIHITNSSPQPHIHNPKEFQSVYIYHRGLGEKSTLALYQETFNKKVHTCCSDACGRRGRRGSCGRRGRSYRKKDNSLKTNDRLTSYSR